MTMTASETYYELRGYCREKDILFHQALTCARERWMRKYAPDVHKNLKHVLGKWCSVKFRQAQVEAAWFNLRETEFGKREDIQQQALKEFLVEEKQNAVEKLIKDFAEVHNRSVSDVTLQAIDEYYSKPGRERPKQLTPEGRKKALAEFLDSQKSMVLNLYSPCGRR